MADQASSTSGLDGVLTSLLGAYGAQNSSQAQNTGILSGIGAQQTAQTNINNIFGTQATTGNGAMTALESALGLNGSAPNPSTFYNMPGYQFAVDQGTQAINREAAAQGSLYTPNTLNAVGQYVTGTASQDYNNYISQLEQTAGLGASANQGLATSNLETAANTSSLDISSGNAEGSGVAGTTGALSSLLSNGSLSSLLSSLSGGISGIGSLFSGGSSGGANTSALTDTTNSSTDADLGLNGLSTDYSYLNPDAGYTDATGNLDLSLNNGTDANSSGFGSSGF